MSAKLELAQSAVVVLQFRGYWEVCIQMIVQSLLFVNCARVGPVRVGLICHRYRQGPIFKPAASARIAENRPAYAALRLRPSSTASRPVGGDRCTALAGAPARHGPIASLATSLRLDVHRGGDFAPHLDVVPYHGGEIFRGCAEHRHARRFDLGAYVGRMQCF